MSTMIGGLPAKFVRKMARKAKALRCAIYDTGCSSPQIAKVLRVPSKTVRDWAEGYEPIPDTVFEVIRAAHKRDQEGDQERSFLDFLPIFARTARLPGFEAD